MTTREAIRFVKVRIKALAYMQKQDKASRKGCGHEKMPTLWGEIHRRSAEITACLNWYLALREHEYRHNVADKYWDARYTKELAEEFPIASKV